MYLNKTDIEKGIYPEILQVISRVAENITQAIEEAIAEVGAYLRARYDINTEFAKSGSQRNTLIIKLVREITIYNCYMISNPNNMPESRLQRYKDTIAFLKDVQSEKANIEGLARLTDADTGYSTYIKFGGNTKRNNHY